MALGGAQIGLLDQARWFHAHGWKVAVVFFYDKQNLHDKWQKSVEFPIYDLNAFKLNVPVFIQGWLLLRGLWRLWHMLLRGKFDVVETFTHDSNLLGLPLAWLAKVPLRLATHRGSIEEFPLWRQTLHNGLVNSKIAHTLIAVSEQTKETAIQEGVLAKKVTVIPNGVVPLHIPSAQRPEIRNSLGLKHEDIFILTVGRLTYQKGHEILIRAMSKVIENHPSACLGICGEGPLHLQLENQIINEKLSKQVMLLEVRNDVAPLLAAADLFVLSSRWEGVSRALMEAMAAGLPVIATSVDGTKKLIQHNVHGILVPPEDPALLAEAIHTMLSSPHRMKQMAERGRETVLKNYSSEAACQTHANLMEEFFVKTQSK